MRYGLLLLVLLGCDSFTAPADARPYDAPPVFREMWARTEQCSGRAGRFERVRWFVTNGPLMQDGRERAGVWESPHSIYLMESYAVDAYRDHVAVRHEMIHDLTQSSAHGQTFTDCDALNVS